MDADFWLKLASFAWTIIMVPVAYLWNGLVKRVKDVETNQQNMGVELRREFDQGMKERDRSIGQIRDSLAEIKAGLAHGPSKDDVHELALKVTELSGSLAEMSAKFDATQSLVARIDNYLLEHASEK